MTERHRSVHEDVKVDKSGSSPICERLHYRKSKRCSRVLSQH